jgi:fibronectin type 3 domain-containing protein
MPFYTKHYGLIAFVTNDFYSASSDKSRFTIIDNHLDFLSELIGDGVVTGWTVSSGTGSNPYEIVVSAGIGMINKTITMTLGYIVKPIYSTGPWYVWMQKRRDYALGLGPFSNIASLVYGDVTPPLAPSYITATGWDYNFISLSWDDAPNSIADFDHYNIYRSEDLFATQSLVGTSVVPDYTDSTVEEETTYRYRISSVDMTGNESGYSPQTGNITTLKDLTVPLPPSYILSFPGDGYIDLMWKHADSSKVSGYQVWLYQLDTQYNIVGLLAQYITDSSTWEQKIDGLLNGTFYKLEVYTVSSSGILSAPIETIDAPAFNLGPTEVQSVSVIDHKSDKNQYGIGLTVSWELSSEHIIESPTNRYVIVIIENGLIVSEPIYVYNKTSIDIELFYSNGSYNAIKNRTDYIVKVQAQDINSNFSNPVLARTETQSYVSPGSPAQLIAYTDSDGNLIFAWENIQEIEYNILNIIALNNTTQITTIIESNTNYGKQSQYFIPIDSILTLSKYTLSLQTVDEFGNVGDTVSVSYETTTYDTTQSLPVPDNMMAYKNDGYIHITWNQVSQDGVYPRYYKIWRANLNTVGIDASDFSLIQTVPSSYTSYDDYDVEPGERYYYFLTTVDIYGNESLNPQDDNYASYVLAWGYTDINAVFTKITDLQVSEAGYDSIVSWDTDLGEYDGVEIWRSTDDKITWTKVGGVPKPESVFIDENALLIGGKTYYYMARKYRNEGQVFITSTLNDAPINSLLLAKVTKSINALDIDNSVSIQARDLTYVSATFMDLVLPVHKHALSSMYDRRIDLSRNVTVSSWTTSDQQIFTTEEDISGATAFIPQISDNTISFTVDTETKTITFSSPIGASTLSVTCVGLMETQDTLDKNKIEELSATQSLSNKMPADQMYPIDHAGRDRAELIPLQLPMVSDDMYAFGIEQNTLGVTESIGDATTFYDVIELADGVVVAGTSNGIRTNKNGTWKTLYDMYFAPHKFFYAPVSQQYFALVGRDVYISADAITWAKCTGLDGVEAVRDAAEDSNGIVYFTTNNGVYTLDLNSTMGSYLICEQSSSASFETSNFYAIIFDGTSIVACSDHGVYTTSDKGITWSESTVIVTEETIRSIYKYGLYFFAITDTSVWRMSPSETSFQKIAYLSTTKARKITIFKNILLITTEDGLMVSKDEYDIFSDTSILFDIGLPKINFSAQTVPVTCLMSTGDNLYVGTDSRLWYGSEFYELESLYNEIAEIIPSVYVDSVLQNIGFTYSISSNIVFFDEKIGYDSEVNVANQYNLFKVDGEGWLDKNYSAYVYVYKNGEVLATMSGTNVLIVAPFETVSFETFTELDANTTTANAYVSEYQSKLADLEAAYRGELIPGDANGDGVVDILDYNILVSNFGKTGMTWSQGDFNEDGVVDIKDFSILSSNYGQSLTYPIIYSQSIVSDLVKAYNRVYSQVIGKVRFASTYTSNEVSYAISGFTKVPYDLYPQIYSEYEIVPHIPSLTISDADGMVSANVSDGLFEVFGTINKYDRFLVDIKNASFKGQPEYTHKEIDDELDMINSGLSLGLAEVQQSNLIKTNLFFERIWPGEQDEPDSCNLDMVSPYNMFYYIPNTNTWYDTLNSTIDYKEQVNFSETSISVPYVTAALYVLEASSVLVGYNKGVVAISTLDLSMSIVNFGGDNEFVRDIKSFDKLYILTDSRLYASDDNGLTWDLDNEMIGVTGQFIQINKIANVLVILTKDGVFYRNESTNRWEQVLSGDGFDLSASGSYIVAIAGGNDAYYSRNGYSWERSGDIPDVKVNCMVPYKNIMLLGTNSGLRLDNSTFYTQNPATGLVDIADDLVLSEDIQINAVVVADSGEEYVSGASDGMFYLWNGISHTATDSGLGAIQYVVYVDGDYWLFGYDKFVVSSILYPMKISTGTPI